MIFSELKERYPRFTRLAEYFEETAPLFMSKNLMLLKASEPDYEFAEKLCRDAWALCGDRDEEVLKLADTMIEFSMEFVYLQRQLDKTGRYLYSTFQEVDEHVYNDPQRTLSGAPYIWALYFTQVFWITHGRLWQFFLGDFVSTHQDHGRVLEVPSGNGLFLTHFLLHNPHWQAVAVDLSETSITFTERVLTLNGMREAADIRKQDFFALEPAEKFDRIICGEFLEHVEDPLRVLHKLKTHLKRDGRLFLTAAVWAANIDHIYLYRSAQEVRDHVDAAGFAMERELVQNVFADHDPDEAKTPINYSAILRHA